MGSLKNKSLSLVYVVYPDKFHLKSHISSLLKKKLIVCANVLNGVQSHYVWKGKVEKSKEIVVIFKTISSKEDMLLKEIEKNHPYEMPFIAVISPKSVNSGYLNFAVQQQSD